MADESIEDGEFWLPPQFLEDDLDCDESGSSELSSLLDSSAASSGEDWSDEEEHLAGMRKKMDGSNCKDWFGSGSPKSTLRGYDGSYGSGQRYDPATVHEAALKFASVRIGEQVGPIGPNERTAKPSFGFFPRQPLPQRQLEPVQIQRMRRQQMIQRMLLGQHQSGDHLGGGGGSHDLHWPTLQSAHLKNNHASHQIARSGTMRATFTAAVPAGPRSCAGTGVFLPRQAGAQPVPRKKRGPVSAARPSTVLIPAKVAQALSLRFERMGRQPPQQFQTQADGGACGIRSSGPEPEPRHAAMNHEIKLPQEWTY